MQLDVEIDAGRAATLWAESGLQAITHARAPVPTRLVAGAMALIEQLDRRGAGLSTEFAAGGLGLLAERAAALMLRPSGRSSCNGVSRLIRSSDGWLALTMARPDDRRLLPAWLGVEIDERSENQTPWSAIEDAAASRRSSELIELAALLGLPCAGVGEVNDAQPVKVEAAGTADPPSLTGLRVVNLASLWAGPLCADVLRRLGADVVCVESTGRPDGARATPAWFDAIHEGQRSVAIDFRTSDGIATLRSLLAAADVVIEGSRPRALEQLGIEAHAMVADARVRVWLSITAYGRNPEAAMRVGMGDDAAAAGGLIATVDESPVFIGDAIADPLTGLVAANAVIDRLESSERGVLDVALGRTARWCAPRDSDPGAALQEPTPPRARASVAPRFEHGAETQLVLGDWLR